MRGELKTLFGSKAVQIYLDDNKARHLGIKRKCYTGKIIRDIPLYVTQSG